jgi:hypothetical protein
MELKNPVAVDKELKDILNDGPHDLQDLQELEGEEGGTIYVHTRYYQFTCYPTKQNL